jgi:cell division control protein 24
MVVREILDSERKYVQDLEVLQVRRVCVLAHHLNACLPTFLIQDYQRQVAANDIITQDQIHNLFLNLNTLADFQRRFLIGVEANASRPPDEQRFGHLFLQMVRCSSLRSCSGDGITQLTILPLQEDHFSVYEPYCANLTAAQDLAIAENASLAVSPHPMPLELHIAVPPAY